MTVQIPQRCALADNILKLNFISILHIFPFTGLLMQKIIELSFLEIPSTVLSPSYIF